MFKSRVFLTWFIVALSCLLFAFSRLNTLDFLIHHWFYPCTMLLGAFVAGFTPEGGGAVAFPVLNLFFNVSRIYSRDFAMMIQSVGMTSASIFILSHHEADRKSFRCLLWIIPLAACGMALGFLNLQAIPVFIIQAMFLSLSASFVTAYYFSTHRGLVTVLDVKTKVDWIVLLAVVVVGGAISSLFGTGGDVLVYTLLVTRFNMKAKLAVQISIVLQAALSLFGYSFRVFHDIPAAHEQFGIAHEQFQTWLCAAPVALFMAPFGAYVLHRLHVNVMLKFIIALNLFQLAYFNFHEPSLQKVEASVIFTSILFAIFFTALRHISRKNKALEPPTPEVAPS